MQADLIIHNTSALITCASPAGPKRGTAMREVGAIQNGAVAIKAGKILAVGDSAEICAEYTAPQMLDAAGMAVCPGFVDSHTHVVYAGDRVDEFEMRIAGKTYQELMAAGGGILSTVRKTRAAPLTQLVAESLPRLKAMLALGTTTAEVKSGYGLESESELKMLQAIEELDQRQPLELVPTFLGAHSIPPEYKEHSDDYVQLVISEMLPTVAKWYAASHFAANQTPFFIDVFCEKGVFSAAQTTRILEAGLAAGLKLKAHVDEFVPLGGTTNALKLGATSLDHLDYTPEAEMKLLGDSPTVAVIIPAVNFNLGSSHYANARQLLENGAALALATDINPGSAPCPSIPLVMAIACRYQRLLPAEALNAATINAAHAVGLGHKVGSIEVGKQADLLVLSTPDYRQLAYQFGGNLVQRVIKKGEVVE